MTRSMLVGVPLALMSAACSLGEPDNDGGEVTITIQQALTGQTTSAGTFTMAGAVADDGQTTEELTFGGPLTQSPVPVTFRRTLVGRTGTLVVKGSASLAFTSPTAAAITGTWSVESGTGLYRQGSGTLSGTANFGATPPTGALTYLGTIRR